MKNTHERLYSADDVRRKSAFNALRLLSAVITRDKHAFRQYRSTYLPVYQLVLNAQRKITLCPYKIGDQGKRRAYVDENESLFVVYFTAKEVRHLATSVYRDRLSTTELDIPAVKNALTSAFADRWIITHSLGGLTNWIRFANNVIAIESDSSRSNHPPLGLNKFATVQQQIPNAMAILLKDIPRVHDQDALDNPILINLPLDIGI